MRWVLWGLSVFSLVGSSGVVLDFSSRVLLVKVVVLLLCRLLVRVVL